ncbi:hypothetical protein MLD38_035100 [Melastoma candidum]|uniref:Uncharacterized protein n=1 Tax=Melastoma candidum TaxID=119954 RepID=A0ACB9MCJ1_9MYRT|nr:hypothetical protein MLD38_035100 [Melastoma candidum]
MVDHRRWLYQRSLKPLGRPSLSASESSTVACLSPTTLLDSPVFLSNSLVQPSPTTGKYPFFPNNSGKSSGLVSEASDWTKKSPFEDSSSSSFAFRPLGDSGGSSFFGSGSKMTQVMLPQHSFPRIDASVQSESSIQPHNIEQSRVQPQNGGVYPTGNEHSQALAESDSALHGIPNQQRAFRSSPIVSRPDLSPPLDDQGDEEGDPRDGAIDPMVGDVGGGPAEDGYNWRKYGQKQVKGSEYPRSYYKCTHTNCPVKKKVERSQEGHITEIIYKSTHNHPKPAPNRRPVIRGPDMPDERMSEHDADPAWANMQKAATAGAAYWRQDNNLEVTSSPSEGQEAGNPATSLPTQDGTRFEAADHADGSSTFSNDEGEDDQQTHGSVSMDFHGDGDESESKRRKIEAYAADMSGATRAIREPRVVVQTTSEVDILDDGYRWRKYGQKVVKGNPNPRSYYKCTSTGCTVRKHVERASHDLKSSIGSTATNTEAEIQKGGAARRAAEFYMA